MRQGFFFVKHPLRIIRQLADNPPQTSLTHPSLNNRQADGVLNKCYLVNFAVPVTVFNVIFGLLSPLTKLFLLYSSFFPKSEKVL